MNESQTAAALNSTAAMSTSRTLRQLFLTLFLRGRSSRGLQKESAPKSVGQKLMWSLLLYALFGLMALSMLGQPIFLLSASLHSMAFLLLGMFVASSAGEVLFYRDEADILLHRPIAPRALLWAKIRVLVEVSCWLAVSLNLAGLFVGLRAADGNWLFPLVHLCSTALMALFTTACVVLLYQLCLRWFGREWLDNMMTTAQVVISVGAVLAGQLVPRLLFRADGTRVSLSDSWWPVLFPPVWFAGVDDVLSGSASWRSVVSALLAVAATSIVVWLTYAKLADGYQQGLQSLGEAKVVRPQRGQSRRFLERMIDTQPWKWWLRDPVVRASFLLTTAYLVRDRDVKLRVYPGLAPFLIFPLLMVMQALERDEGRGDSVLFAFASGYVAVLPMIALDILKFSQNWQAADLFRAVPLPGPARVYRGARRAVYCFIVAPIVALLGISLLVIRADVATWLLMLPGLMALPIFAILPHVLTNAVPFSQPTEEAKGAGRGLAMMGAMFAAVAVSMLGSFAQSSGWLDKLLLTEAIVVGGLYLVLHAYVRRTKWRSLE